MNNPPDTPGNLDTELSGFGIILKWNDATDDKTPPAGLNYNIRLGTTPGSSDIIDPMSDLETGYRKITTPGNALLNNEFRIDSLPEGTYYWSVQAIDNTKKGGAWAPEESFNISVIRPYFDFETVCFGDIVHFTDQTLVAGGSITSWHWDFGDGQTSDEQNPVHLYGAPGYYTVQLTASTDESSSSVAKIIYVKPRPVADFTASAACLLANPTKFVNNSVTDTLEIDEWYWTFGDGTESYLRNPPDKLYLSAGNFNVKLNITAHNGCTDTISQTAMVGVFPTAVITSNLPLEFCNGDSTVLSVGYKPQYTYQWMLDGASLTDADSSKFTARFTGNYTVEVVNSIGNCSTLSSGVDVISEPAPAPPFINVEGNTSFCQGDSTILSVIHDPSLNYQWKLNGGAVGINSYIHSAKASGTYTLTVTNSTGCSANSTNSINVTVNPRPTLPTVNISGPTTFCEGSNVELSVTKSPAYIYQWENNGATLSADTLNTYIAGSSGVYSLKITNSSGCFTKTENVTVNVLTAPAAPFISASKALEFCQGDSVELSITNTDGYLYQWTKDGGAVGLNSSKFAAKSSGTYNVTVKNTNNCSAISTNSVTVKVNDAPSAGNISLTGPVTFCQGGSVTLSVPATTGYTYAWRNQSGFISGALSNSFTVSTTGTCLLEVTIASECNSVTPPVSITVNPAPDKPVLISENYTEGVCPGVDPIRLNVSNMVSGYSYTWIKDGELQYNDTLTYIEFYEKGTYKVRAELGECTSESEAKVITLPDAPEKPILYVKGPVVWYMAAKSNMATQYQWYRDDEAIQGATKYIYVANKTLGTYKVAVGNQNNCFTMSDEKTIPVSKSEMTDFYIPAEFLVGENADLSESVKLYPNPNTGVFTVEMENDITGEIVFSVITEQGKEISNIKSEKTTGYFKTEIDLGGDPKGVYIINLKIDKYTATRKIIIE